MASDNHPTGHIVSNADDLLGLFDADFVTINFNADLVMFFKFVLFTFIGLVINTC